MLGIIIAVIVSNWIGDWIHYDGIYESDLEAKGAVVHLRALPPAALFAKTAGEIASQAVWYDASHPLKHLPIGN